MELDLQEITIDQLQAGMAGGSLTARQLAEAYLQRIESVDRDGPRLRSIIETNPDALDIADGLDRERARGHVRGPLHGIPVVIKDNIDTADRMQTTAGSLALVGAPVARDAPVVEKLRQAGAVLLAKSNLSEWANYRSNRSSSGWSGRGRQTRNPFVLDRSPGGSSSGSGASVSANLCVAALGTETDGSIMSPSSNCGIVGIKPTVGLTSRSGVVPISHSQDSVGPHARTLRDATLVLSAISGTDFSDALDRYPSGRLEGVRIGVLRKFHTGYNEHTDAVFESALDVLRQCGAEVVDEIELPGEADLREHFDADATSESIVLQFEFKTGLAQYLTSRPDAAVHTLADVIRFNEEHRAEEMPYFEQERLVVSQARGSLDDELYKRALERNQAFGRDFGAFFATQAFDALVAPTNAPPWAIDLFDGDRPLGGSASPAAVAGFPLVTVPAGYAAGLLPLGLTFMGPALSEATLISVAHAFERAHPVRRAPTFVASTLHLP